MESIYIYMESTGASSTRTDACEIVRGCGFLYADFIRGMDALAMATRLSVMRNENHCRDIQN